MKRLGNRGRIIKRWGLLTVLLGVGGVNVVRGWLALRFAPALAGYEVSMAPVLLAGFYGIWAVILVGGAAVCFLRSPCYARPVAVIYQVTFWGVRLLGDRTTTAEGLGWQQGVLSMGFLALIWVLSARRTPRGSA
jgi:hypothetical protein